MTIWTSSPIGCVTLADRGGTWRCLALGFAAQLAFRPRRLAVCQGLCGKGQVLIAERPDTVSAPIDVAVGILMKPNGDVLLGQRPDGKPYAGYWEFPGGQG